MFHAYSYKIYDYFRNLGCIMFLRIILTMLVALSVASARVDYVINENSKDKTIAGIPVNVTHLTIRRVLDSAPDLTHLTSLVKVDLTENRIPDPDVPLSELLPPSVRELILKQNQLTSVPDVIGLAGLQVLNLQANQIARMDKPLSELFPESLEDVNLGDNPLKTMPEFLDIDFPNLKQINLFYMSGMDIQMDRLSKQLPISLEKLILKQNQLTSVPDVIGLAGLQVLNLQANRLPA